MPIKQRVLQSLVWPVLAILAASSFICFSGTPARAQCVTNLDQQQGSSNSTAGGDRWQSFTAGLTGSLTRIDVDVTNAASTTLEIYAGEGTGGTLLHSQGVSLAAGSNSISIGGPVSVVAGQTYTMRFLNINAWHLQVGGNPYAGGRSSVGPNDDFVFQTFVEVCPVPAMNPSALLLFAVICLMIGVRVRWKARRSMG